MGGAGDEGGGAWMGRAGVGVGAEGSGVRNGASVRSEGKGEGGVTAT